MHGMIVIFNLNGFWDFYHGTNIFQLPQRATEMGQGVSTESIHLQSYYHYFSNDNLIISVTTKKGLSYVLGKFLLKIIERFSKNHVECPLFLATKKFWLPSKKL
jgi:hypothetical protein